MKSKKEYFPLVYGGKFDKEVPKRRKNRHSTDSTFLMLNHIKYSDEEALLQLEFEAAKRMESRTEKEIKHIKAYISYALKELTAYFLFILKKGNDCRSKGFVWAVKRLLELNVELNTSNFPRFLDLTSITYLLEIGNMEMKIDKLSAVLTTLTLEKKWFTKEKRTKVEVDQIKKFALKARSSFYVPEEEPEPADKLTDLIESQIKDFQNLLKINKDNDPLNEQKIEKIVKNIKGNMGVRDTFISIFTMNKDLKEKMSTIFELREVIENLRGKLEEKKKEYMRKFKLKHEGLKYKSLENHIHFELVFSALFGNNITV